MSENVKYDSAGKIAIITMDDAKANALSPQMLADLDAAFDEAEGSARAVVLTGRPGRFSAGFDLRVMMAGPDPARDLLHAGADFFMRVYEFPLPVVMACSGHALAGGALLLATGDTRIGIRGDFKIGLNEVSNGMPVPILAHQLATDRLDPKELVASVLQAKIYDPDGAAAAGWLDRTVDDSDLAAEALAEAERLAQLPAAAYAISKASLRRTSIDHIRETMEADFASLTKLLGG